MAQIMHVFCLFHKIEIGNNFFKISFFFLGPHLQHRLKSELQLPAYTTATPDPSGIGDLCHSVRQHQVLNQLAKARDPTRILMDTRSAS